MKNYIELLKKYNQEHILKYVDMVDEKKKNDLINQIEKINFEELNKLYEISNRDNTKAIKGIIIEHIPFVDKYKLEKERKD